MRNNLLPELENDREVQLLYEEEGLVLEVTEAICELMQKQNIKRSELARRLGVDKSYITQLLDGSSNMTLKTIADVMFCLDYKAKIKIEPLTEQFENFATSLESLGNYQFFPSNYVSVQKNSDNQTRLVA